MPLNNPNFVAGGDIRICRFVKQSTSADYTVLEADANEQTIGISQEGTNDAPTSGASSLAAASGDPVAVYGLGDVCLLTIGSGGVTRGGRLKSDADGKGVAVATTGTTIQQIGARALESAAENELCRVQIVQYSERPALT